MGYYTEYNLKIETDQIKADQIAERLEEISNEIFYHEIGTSDEEGVGRFYTADIKWYSHNEHMKQLSTEFPSGLFILHGIGEDGEQWKEYYKNGKMFIASSRVVFDEYDESKLS